MAEDTEKSRLRQIAEVLVAHGVEFIVIGGQAEVLHGSSRMTRDVDLCYSRSKPNLIRLVAALKTLQPRLRGAPPDVPFLLDARSLELGCNFTFETAICDLDLLGYVEPFGGYEEIARRAVTSRVANLDLKVMDLDDLIRVKRHINRAKDRESLLHLLAIKRVREEDNKQA